MAFSFSNPAIPLDQMQLQPTQAPPTPAQIDPSQYTSDLSTLMAQRASGQAPQAPAPQQQSSGAPPLQDIPVSPVEALMGWLAHGGTPGEAAQSVRAVKLQNMMDMIGLQQAQQKFALAQKLQGPAQLDYLTAPVDYAKADAENFKPQILKQGETALYRGGNGQPGGYGVFAPQTGVSPTGVPYAITKDGYQALAPQQAGDKSVSASGAVIDSHLGPTGQVVSVPNNVPLGTTPGDFIPRVVGGPAGGAPQGAAVPALAGVVGQGKFDPAAFIKSFILPHEGGLNPHDMNGAPSKFGINQTANPGVDVPNLTPDQATQIYMSKYLPASGAANLPPALAAVHLDTSVINPQRAQQFLQQSGGDPSKYMDLRDQWMQHMVANNPAAAPYAKAWGQRNADLRHLIGGQGGSSAPAASDDANSPGFHALGVAAKPQIIPATDPAYKGFPPGTVLQKAADGTISQMPGTGVTYDQRVQAKLALENSDDVKEYRKANTAWGAMLQAATQPQGGMRAYAMRDTFARLINPGAVARAGTIQAIKESQGVPENIRAYLLNLKGDGDVPAATLQQILDVSHGFLMSHYSTAKSLRDSFASQASRNGIDPREVTPDIPDHSPAAFIPTPPAANQQQRKPGIYATPKGPLEWTGAGWTKPY